MARCLTEVKILEPITMIFHVCYMLLIFWILSSFYLKIYASWIFDQNIYHPQFKQIDAA